MGLKYERTVTRELPVLLDTEAQLEVQQRYIAACKAREAYLQTWEHQKAAHKEVMEGHNEVVHGLFMSMDSGLANQPVDCDLEIDKESERYRLVRIDTSEEVCSGPLAEWLMQDGAEVSDGAARPSPVRPKTRRPGRRRRRTATPLEGFPGEVLDDAPAPGDAGAREFWRGCMDAAISVVPDSVVVDAKLPKSWPTRADSLYALTGKAEEYRRVAYGMGANARSQEKAIRRCPFDTGSTDDIPLVQAWKRGWTAVARALEEMNAIDAAEVGNHG